jgi:hypothetical protein
MSTIFQVFPTKPAIPSFRSLIQQTEPALAEFVERRAGLRVTPRITLSLLEKETNRSLPLDLDAPARWSETTYAWFSIAGLAGGTDAYFLEFDKLDRWIWLEECERHQYAAWKGQILSALAIGHSWQFRRSAGQPASICVAYAVIAAQLATACGGFIDSGDSAWDYTLLPAWPSAFLEKYFDPTATKSQDMAGWARRCIAALHSELT